MATQRTTPSHPAQSSPAPRSVPSPVASRAAGKTPVNHPTTGSTGSKTLTSTPMVQNLSQTGNTSSPSANMLSFGTPSGLGIDGITPGALNNLPTPGVGTAMVATMSELGLVGSGGKRNEDEERRARMRRVLKRIGSGVGRVSEEGIARVARRVGFQNDIDVEKLTPEERERKVGNRPIQTAGNTVVIDFDLKNNIPRGVQVAFGETKTLKEQNQPAGRVLLNDLASPGGVTFEAKLDRFAMNMERLARMDRLSSQGVNCFEAMGGVYSSLSRLFDQEVRIAETLFKQETSNLREKANTEVMCKKSGRPLLHSRGKLGLEVIYWQDSRRVINKTESQDTDMDIDTQDEFSLPSEHDNSIFTLRIEAEAHPASLYPPLRVSDLWLPDPLDLLTSSNPEMLPWQEPPTTFLLTDAKPDAMMVDGSEQKVPDLRFVAKFNPPLVMPYQVAANVLSTVSTSPPQMLVMPPQYAAVLLDPQAGAQGHAPATSFTKTAVQTVLSVGQDGDEKMVKHEYRLDCAKPNYADYGCKISEMPFSHPRQVVEVLPTLRQWARVGSLLKTSFASNDLPSNGAAGEADVTNLTLEELMNRSSIATRESGLRVDITLATSPVPTLGVTFPTKTPGKVGNVSLQILSNAEILVSSHEGIFANDMVDAAEQGQRLARALDVCDDLGVWVEWMRMRM